MVHTQGATPGHVAQEEISKISSVLVIRGSLALDVSNAARSERTFVRQPKVSEKDDISPTSHQLKKCY